MSSNLTISSIPDDLKEKLRKFRFGKSAQMQAIILKIDKDTHNIILDEEFEDCTIDELREELPSQQPRFVLLSYAIRHADGRTSYPMCLIFYSPPGCSPEQQMLYAGSRNSLVSECELTKNFDIRDVDDFTKEFIDSKVV
ncbi:unnamed protein product, partial [Mesorhabditis belari]|uniref:ADF-H domain-containing protein n=1 Tax=Mesorhabditis belari TaxID=2138241 RepID=A0AAF3J1U0_9BILA